MLPSDPQAISDNKDPNQSKWNYNPSARLPRLPRFRQYPSRRVPEPSPARCVPARRSSGPRGEPRAVHDLAISAPPLSAFYFTLRSKSFPPRRDGRNENNQRTPSAGAWAQRGRWKGSGPSTREQPPAQPPSQPGGQAGWGSEVTQRSRRDKRHPLALASIPERPAR